RCMMAILYAINEAFAEVASHRIWAVRRQSRTDARHGWATVLPISEAMSPALPVALAVIAIECSLDARRSGRTSNYPAETWDATSCGSRSQPVIPSEAASRITADGGECFFRAEQYKTDDQGSLNYPRRDRQA